MRILGLAVLGLLLVACDQVSATTDKASVCAEALGLSNLNPNLDPEQLAAQAQQKADRLRELAGQVADQDLKQNLFTIADSYVALEQRKAQHLGDLNDWVQRNANNLSALRAACL
ncbi:hypothetical protein FHX82_002241 [Amycolatopsis bartoniae]|uniref:Lipoprotein n=1 Tax=Amycolatopsis bartoniae TaxID=941986 RepID=A0A8H9J274_9PSEU|nr:hypothetical protein [Amycolatopsis bartoniae]MBB2935221.1 hypothetical protein [Amycolatopsis bartoniae]TVT04070.1 hypothetical protein FNH07_24610 [Amycolatopsis bartoniae]GHF75192.1 hypothetical protein GCM10017566_56400 [Amycolatopsis bartoniae]